jgi:hypothetical protein
MHVVQVSPSQQVWMSSAATRFMPAGRRSMFPVNEPPRQPLPAGEKDSAFVQPMFQPI